MDLDFLEQQNRVDSALPGLADVLDEEDIAELAGGLWDMSIPIYGNWCGPHWGLTRKKDLENHGGGTPVDDIDCACRNHDYCYDRVYAQGGSFERCDFLMRQDIDRALDTGDVRPWGRIMGPIIRAFFTHSPDWMRHGEPGKPKPDKPNPPPGQPKKKPALKLVWAGHRYAWV